MEINQAEIIKEDTHDKPSTLKINKCKEEMQTIQTTEKLTELTSQYCLI